LIPVPYIIAEAAQGYEADVGTVRLLIRAAAAGGADAIKFQIVFANDLAQPGYQHFELFRSLEMPADAWRKARDEAHVRKLAFVADIFGRESLAVAREIGVDAVKLHSTTFFDRALTKAAFSLGVPVYRSVGGIKDDEIQGAVELLTPEERKRLILLFGYQQEPTPIEKNNLARVASLAALTGAEVGFMDHSDGAGPDRFALSILALGLGVRVFEKHITLDRRLEMEDFVSALGADEFAVYVAGLRRLASAIGTPSLTLTDDEMGYREKVLKRVAASRDLQVGTALAEADISFVRPAQPGGALDPALVLGRTLARSKRAGEPLDVGDLTP
jgi:N,N'-diacetyllegionaminate synthase